MAKRIVETVVKYEKISVCRTASQMEQICCELTNELECCKPTGELQCCEISDGSWNGYTAQELLDEYHPNLDSLGRDEQGRYVVIQLDSRKNPCGQKIIEYDLSGGQCCDEVSDIVWSWDNPDVLPADSNVSLSVSGGRAPYNWVTTSNGTFFSNGSRSISTSSASVILYADLSFCGGTSVSASDGCSSVSNILRSSEGEWVEAHLPDYACGPLSGLWPDSIVQDGDSVRLYLISGLIKQEDRVSVDFKSGFVTSEGFPKPGDPPPCEGIISCLEGTGETNCSCLIERMYSSVSHCMLIPFGAHDTESVISVEEYCISTYPYGRMWRWQQFSNWNDCLDSDGNPYSPRKYEQHSRWYSFDISYVWEWKCI